MKKKLLALMLTAALALSLAACGGGTGDNSSTDTPSTENGDTASANIPNGGGEDSAPDEATPPEEPANDVQVFSSGDTVTIEHFEFTPVFEGFADEVANWPDENYLTPDGEFYGSNPFKASEEKTLMWFSGTVNDLGGATSNESFTYSYKIVYDNNYEFELNQNSSKDAYTYDIASGEWARENGRIMQFEPLSSKTTRHIRFFMEVPEQVKENTDKELSVVFTVSILDANGNSGDKTEYIYKIR